MSDIIKPDFERTNWPDSVRLKMIEKSEFYSNPDVYQFGFYDGYQMQNAALLSTVKRLQEENEQLNQWKREEIAVWGPLYDYFLKEDKLINLGESIAEEALRRSKQYVRLLVVLKAIMNEYDSKGQLLGFNVNIVREALKSELNK